MEVRRDSQRSVESIAMTSPAEGRKSSVKLVFSLTLLTVVLGIAALCVGNYGIGFGTAIKILLSPIVPFAKTWTDMMETVVFDIRLPRIGASLLVGGALSLSGATYQGVFRNPLVSPDLLGVSSGACVGAAAAILMGFDSLLVQLAALGSGLAAVAITTAIPRLLRNPSSMTLVLSGIVVSGFMTSALGLQKYIADPETQLAEITYWTLGSLSKVEGGTVGAVLPVMGIAAAILIAIRWRINLLSLGDRQAMSLGLNIRSIRGIAIVCSTALTACAVCISGTVGWVGLVIPHLSRIFVGPDNARLLPVSFLLGASFMLLVDTLARSVTMAEIPLGILTGFVGAPLFLWMLMRQRVRVK